MPRHRTRTIGPWTRDILTGIGFVAATVVIFWMLPRFAVGFQAIIEMVGGQ